MIVALVAGLWPAVAAVVITATGTAFVLIDGAPEALAHPGRDDVTRWLVFLAISVLVVAVGCIARWALAREAAARRDLEEARVRLDLSLDAGRMGVWSAHPTTHEFWCGEEAREVLGVAEGERIDTLDDLVRCFHPDDRDGVRAALARSEWGAGQDLQVRLAASEPRDERWVLLRGKTRAGSPGRTPGMVGVVMDVTGHKRRERRDAFLARLAADMNASMDLAGRVERLASHLSEGLGDACVVRLTSGFGSCDGAAAVDGQAVPLMAVDRHASADALALSEDLCRMLDAPVPAATAPLRVHGATIGTIAVARRRPAAELRPEEIELLGEAADRASLSIENARLFERHRDIAQTLQRSLLPPDLPHVPDLELAASYEAAGEGVEVGGDFYDAFETAKGCWVVAIGDVCGKGTAAASLTALARHTLRVAALVDPQPGRMLEALNTALRHHADATWPIMTAACVLIDRRPGEMEVTLARAGHPPPVLIDGEKGSVEALEPAGPLLGVFDDITVEDATVVLAPHSSLVLYTDGITEARGADGLFGTERLMALVDGSSGLSAADIVHRITTGVDDYRSGTPSDDTAVLVLRRVPFFGPTPLVEEGTTLEAAPR